MPLDYYKGCQITLRAGTSAKEHLARVKKRLAKEYAGAEIIVEETAGNTVEAIGATVRHGHPLEGAGEIDEKGKLVRSMGGDVLFQGVMGIVEEEVKAPAKS